MKKQYIHKKFTPEEVKILAANKFTSKVDFYHIWYTLEFQNLFLSRYEAGERSREIFESLGYDMKILGENRVYGCYQRLTKRLERCQGLTETAGQSKLDPPQSVDYNILPAQQSVASMQRELKYLRQQVDFLKKIFEAEEVKK